MADAYGMTPGELRDLAAKKEAARYRPPASVLDGPTPAPAGAVAAREPWEREIEAFGRSYRVDMRPLLSRRFISMVAALDGAKADEVPVSKQLEMIDFALAPTSPQITEQVVREKGYEDGARYYEIAAKLFEEMQAKN